MTYFSSQNDSRLFYYTVCTLGICKCSTQKEWIWTFPPASQGLSELGRSDGLLGNRKGKKEKEKRKSKATVASPFLLTCLSAKSGGKLLKELMQRTWEDFPCGNECDCEDTCCFVILEVEKEKSSQRILQHRVFSSIALFKPEELILKNWHM